VVCERTVKSHEIAFDPGAVRNGIRLEIGVVTAHVQPVDAWYLLPIAVVGRAKGLRFCPDIESRRPMWEKYREVPEGGRWKSAER